MQRSGLVVAMISVFLVWAAPAQAGSLGLGIDSTTGQYEFNYGSARYQPNSIHVYGDSTSTVFSNYAQPFSFNNYTPINCQVQSVYKVSCQVAASSVRAWLGAENDYYRATGLPWLSSTIYGHAGADGLIGGAGNDRLYGGSGNDELVGRLGSNYEEGNLGYDSCWDAVFGPSCEVQNGVVIAP
jgi:Ca2+-binding RTX toxin-like protein